MTEERNSCCAGRAAWPLIVSVALNLFLVGVLAGPIVAHGPMFAGGPRGFRPPPEPGMVFERVAKDLPAEDAKKLREITADERGAAQKQHETMRKTMAKLDDIMKADKPNVGELHKVLAELRDFGQGMHDRMAKTLERIITELSPESRRLIAEKMKMQPRPMGEDGKERRDQRPPMGDERGPWPPKGAIPAQPEQAPAK